MSKQIGRPRKEIDQKMFEGLCAIQCTEEEIADAFDVSADTISRWCQRTYKKAFAEVFAQKRGKGRISLRRAQFRLAEKSASMAIWLGKQYLNQRDNVDVSITGENAVSLDDLETMVIGFDTSGSDCATDE